MTSQYFLQLVGGIFAAIASTAKYKVNYFYKWRSMFLQ